MTSNAGSNLNNNSIGFGRQTVDKNKVLDNLKQVFRPEFLNRVDEVVAFESLSKEQLLQIIDLMLKDTYKALSEKNITLTVTQSAKEFLLEKGTNLKFGARPLRRAIQRHLEDELSEKILRSELSDGNSVTIDVANEALNFSINNEQ